MSTNLLGVIEQFFHPPISTCSLELIPGVFSNDGDVDRPRGPIGVDAFGIRWTIFAIPDGYGHTVPQPFIYENAFLTLNVIHTMIDGTEVVTDFFQAKMEGYLMFNQAAPTRVHYSALPGVVVILQWILFL